MKAIELKPTDLLAVVVPEHAIRATVYKSENDKYVLRWIDDIIHIMEFQEEHILLGTCTKDHIDFDVEPYVESIIAEEKLKIYKEYYIKLFTVLTKEESFRSLLTANGILFENPYGGKKPYKDASKLNDTQSKIELLDKWQQAESQLTPKVLILKKLK